MWLVTLWSCLAGAKGSVAVELDRNDILHIAMGCVVVACTLAWAWLIGSSPALSHLPRPAEALFPNSHSEAHEERLFGNAVLPPSVSNVAMPAFGVSVIARVDVL